MAYFQLSKDYETSKLAGAGGLFQIDALIDGDATDATPHIDTKKHFRNDTELKQYLAQVFGVPVQEIDLDEL